MRLPLPLLKSLIYGAMGGAIFWALGLPAPWLSGATIAVAAAALSGANVAVPTGLTNIAFIFLGAAMGSGVSPESFALIGQWPLSLAMLVLCVGAMMLLGARYLEHVHKFDRATARLSSVPGALNYVIAVALESPADARRVAILQTIRLTTLVVIMPLLVTAFYPGEINSSAEIRATAGLSDILLLLAVGALGGFVARWVKIPAPFLFRSLWLRARFSMPAVWHPVICRTGCWSQASY